MKTLFIMSLLLFPFIFIIIFCFIGTILFRLSSKAQKVKKVLIEGGYPDDNIPSFLSIKNKARNLQDSIEYGYFTFNYYLVINFGKDVFNFLNNNSTIKSLVEDLRSLYRLSVKLLLIDLAVLLIGMLFIFLMAYFFGSYF